MPPALQRRDLVVIGAGINGAAIARELALQGVSVLVLEREDLACGTSSASTRLIHGGLRYLEHAEFALVRESLREREILLETAPHLVRPLGIHLPIYTAARRVGWKINVGLWLYDRLFPSPSLPRHQRLSAGAMKQVLPGLRSENLAGGMRYFDAQLEFPERLIVELAIDAARHGTVIATRSTAVAIAAEAGGLIGVQWTDASGALRHTLAKAVVNAAGPWVDRVLPETLPGRLVGGSKGSHLVLAPFAGAPEAAVYAEAQSDGRPFFVIPWNGLILIGTTDERFDADPASVVAEEHECSYLLREAEHLFPAAGPLTGALCYTQAGVRPLPYRPAHAVGAVTRRHVVHAHRRLPGLYSIIGGKLTTHRALAEDVLHALAQRLGLGRPRSLTRRRALPGALDAAARGELMTHLTARVGPAQAERLWRIYGGRSAMLADLLDGAPELGIPLGQSGVMTAELVYALEHEWAVSLIDLMQRRCMAGLDADFGLGAARAAADSLARLGIWDPARAEREVSEYRGHAARHHARALAGLS
jgi:glycerol-3-phosphate dehydrogenase